LGAVAVTETDTDGVLMRLDILIRQMDATLNAMLRLKHDLSEAEPTRPPFPKDWLDKELEWLSH